MNRRERNPLAVLAQVRSGDLTLATAGEAMALTYRQAKRVGRRYRLESDSRSGASATRKDQSTAQIRRVTPAGAGAL